MAAAAPALPRKGLRFTFTCGDYLQRISSASGEALWEEFFSSGAPKGFTFREEHRQGEGDHATSTDGSAPKALLSDSARGMLIQLQEGCAEMSVDGGQTWFQFSPAEGHTSTGTFEGSAGEQDCPSTAAQPAASPAFGDTLYVYTPEVGSDGYLNVVEKSGVLAAALASGGGVQSLPCAPPLPAGRGTVQHFPTVKILPVKDLDCAAGGLETLVSRLAPDLERLYEHAVGLATENMTAAPPGSKLVAAYPDAAFNGCLFLWDTVFMLEFWRWAPGTFPAQRALDNFYALQVPDGYICREIRGNGAFQWHPSHPCGTGPNLFAWSEWRHLRATGDRARAAAVLPHLAAYHRWTRKHRSWQDGSYWSNGYACGMDNIDRVPSPSGLEPEHMKQAGAAVAATAHGHMSWVDATAQALLSCVALLALAKAATVQGEGGTGTAGMADVVSEAHALASWCEAKAWDEAACWYCDVDRTGASTGIKTAAAWWVPLALQAYFDVTLTAEAASACPKQHCARIKAMAAHLHNPSTFGRHHLVPALAADEQGYCSSGHYWKGGVWPPMVYAAALALQAGGEDADACRVVASHLGAVARTFRETGRIWENYAPDSDAAGDPARPNFVGWGGLGPIALCLSHVVGLAWEDGRLTISPRHRHGVQVCGWSVVVGGAWCVVLDVAVTPHATGQPTVSVQAQLSPAPVPGGLQAASAAPTHIPCLLRWGAHAHQSREWDQKIVS